MQSIRKRPFLLGKWTMNVTRKRKAYKIRRLRSRTPYNRNMRILIALTFLGTPAFAWEFSATPVCTLSHTEASASVAVTFDHATSLYAIAITRPGGWPDAPAFSMRFDGDRPNTISTQNHRTDGQTLSVTDSGFGNVLDGLEFNTSATAFTQTADATVTLNGAAEPVQQFRACAEAPIA